MFGYVNVYKDELKVCEYNQFQAYYCGLCKAIGKLCSQTARLGLSYDMTFLAILLSAVENTEIKTEAKPCAAHPLVKRKNVINDRAVDYAADMSVLLAYLKFYDDWQDEKSLKALGMMLLYRRAVRRAKKRNRAEYEKIRVLLNELSVLEKHNSKELDAAADCFAQILSVLFTPDFISVDAERRVLAWLGYNTGRWIYIIDAFADLEEDEKHHSYNPLIARGYTDRTTLSRELEVTMTYTLHNIAASYELLKVYKNDEILRNILYLGLKMKQDAILSKYNKEETDESV